MTAASFNEVKSVAVGRHQVAMADAAVVFRETVAWLQADHQRFHDAYQQQFDLVKSDPEYDTTTIREQLAIEVDLRPAHDELDRAVRAADERLHTELQELARQHDVTIFTGAYPTT
jgi:hypothetical protein